MGLGLGEAVTAIDISDQKLALAESLGASTTLNAASNKVVKELRGKGGVHIALVTSASRAAYDMPFSCVRPTGTLLAVELPPETICFPPLLIPSPQLRIPPISPSTPHHSRSFP